MFVLCYLCRRIAWMTLKSPKLSGLLPYGSTVVVLLKVLHSIFLSMQTEADRKYIGPDRWYAPVLDKNHPVMREKPIQNFPTYGFNLTYFPQKNLSSYIPPSVMVQFNTIMTNHVIRIKCVAWVANPDKGENPEESEIYTAHFRFLITK